MEQLLKLLFELSNEDRMNILTELQSSKLKLSQISKKHKIAVAEASRHLQRLKEDKLIQKNMNGTYQLTQLGDTTLSIISNLRFLTEQKEFFLRYDLSSVPYDLINRIGELEKSEYINETFRNIEFAQEKFQEAEKYIWIFSDQILRTSIPTIQEKIKDKNFEVRLLLPESIMPPENQSLIPSTYAKVQKRTLPQIHTIVLATDKHSFFSVPTANGKMDYTGFNSNNDRFRKWCKDLFIHYWETAKKPNSII